MNFAVRAPEATWAVLVLYPDPLGAERIELELHPTIHRSGAVWHVEVASLAPPFGWGWRVDGDAPGVVLLDPRGPAVVGGWPWGRGQLGRRRSLYPGRVTERDRPPRPAVDPAGRVIYELHLRGFTRDPSSGVGSPGTYLGLVEKIHHLRDLGVTTVEILPPTEFDEREIRRCGPGGEPLLNLWGYSPISFFAPHAGYAASGAPGAQITELQSLVDELHRHGLELFADLVLNHTGEGEGRVQDPVWCWRGLDPRGFYLVEPDGRWRDVTGCGNTVRSGAPAVEELLLDALRWWVETIGVDGVRFDLAAVLARDEEGEPTDDPGLLDRIAADPRLDEATLIAEPWDAGGLSLEGTMWRRGRWLEWNGRFRDDVRRFVRGEPGTPAVLATRLAGSSDLYPSPLRSVNYVTCHDGSTLTDLVTYERKRNEANGEGNRDGSDHEWSWNCGVEGPSTDPAVCALRRRQRRNLLTLLFCAQGTPMLLGGDELGRTQRGNNNAYCQDNETSWVDWRGLELEHDLHGFVRDLVALRARHPALRRSSFLTGEGEPSPDVRWGGASGPPEWGPEAEPILTMLLTGALAPSPDDDLFLVANATGRRITVPLPSGGSPWYRVLDTAREPRPIRVPAPRCRSGRLRVSARSVVLCVAPRARASLSRAVGVGSAV